jgi:prephenate dehydratase
MKNTKRKVLIQGFRGSYHEMAARRYFRDEMEIIPTLTFDELFRLMQYDSSLFGIVAIENSVSGSILPNYNLINESGFFIRGEVKMRVALNLLAYPSQDISDIYEVRSQSLALMQCREFFTKYPDIKMIESADTALSAKEVSELKMPGVGVVASSLAAELYGLDILAPGIESNSRNYTRFLVLESVRDEAPGVSNEQADVNKASVVIRLPHRKGSLVEVLSVFSSGECNLTTVQSTPLIGREWEYLFYVDMTFESHRKFQSAVEKASAVCSEIRVLGEYFEGEVFDE